MADESKIAFSRTNGFVANKRPVQAVHARNAKWMSALPDVVKVRGGRHFWSPSSFRAMENSGT